MATYTTPYLTQQNLTDAWGQQVMLQLFDDTNTGVLNASAIALVISRSQAQTSSWMPDTYNGVLPFPGPIPEMIQELSFAYARFYAFPRNLDLMRAIGETRDKMLAEAEGLGKQLQAAIKRMIDAPAPMDNVGGEVESNDPNTGFRPKPLFFLSSMGDY